MLDARKGEEMMRPIVALCCWLILFVLSFEPFSARAQSPDYIADVAWSDDGSALLVATTDTIYVYEAGKWEALPKVWPLGETFVRSIDVSGHSVVVGSDTSILIFNFLNGKRIFEDVSLRGYATFRTGEQLVTGAFAVRIVDIASGRQLPSFGSFYWPVSAFAVSPDGAYVAAANGGEGGYLWKTDTGEPITQLPDATDFAFSSDGASLVYSLLGNELTVWDVAANKQRWRSIPYKGNGAMSVAFYPDDSVIVAAYRDGMLMLCDAKTGAEVDRVKAYQPAADNRIIDYGLAYSPDGELLAAGGSDGAVHIWDMRGGHFADKPVAILTHE
jgi:WD40 repeat protein